MNQNSGSRKLPLIMLAFGIAGLLLRMGLYAVVVDAKGLLLRNHPLTIALTVLTAAALTVVVLAVRKMEKDCCFEDCYPANMPAALGSVAAAVGILATVFLGAPAMGGYLGRAWRLLGLAAPVGLLLCAMARVQGNRPFFLCHVAVCLFYVLHVVTRYQLWSGNPQLQDYLFSLLGCMTLMFFGFYAAALEAGCGNRRMTMAMGLAAIYLCMTELGQSSDPWLYLGGTLWVLTDLVSMRKPAAHEEK